MKPVDGVADDQARKRKESVVAYAARLRQEGYLPQDSEREEEKSMSLSAPYIISPDEFGELDEFDQISLTYYSDGVLADDNDETIEDIDDVVGIESLRHFGEYEADSVFVRNNARKCDYEILLDQRPYSEILKAKPYLRKGE